MKKTSFILIVLLLLPAVKLAWTDVHIISQATRTYRERETNYTNEYWFTEGKSYEIGLMHIFPQGVGTLNVNDIEIACQNLPTEINQLFHLKIVDTDWKSREKPFDLIYDRKEGSDIYINVVLTTPVFTLKAPKIRLKEKGQRVKVSILARVKQ